MFGKRPRIKVTPRLIGILYHFFEKRQPEIIDMLKELVAAERPKILSGGLCAVGTSLRVRLPTRKASFPLVPGPSLSAERDIEEV